MEDVKKFLFVPLLALVVGFAGAELMGPSATSAAQGTCDMEICYNWDPSTGVEYWCHASAALVWCDANEFLETCNTRDCEPE